MWIYLILVLLKSLQDKTFYRKNCKTTPGIHFGNRGTVIFALAQREFTEFMVEKIILLCPLIFVLSVYMSVCVSVCGKKK